MNTAVFFEHTEAPKEKFMKVFPKHQIVEDRAEGAIATFTNNEFAEEFAKKDPFVLEGLISKVTIKEWLGHIL